MKKILLSILAIALTVGTVSASAYALFSDTASVSGVTITTGRADLVLYDEGSNTELTSQIVQDLLNGKLGAIYPGFTDYTNVTFKNNSTSNIGLDLKMRLTNAGGDWGLLNDKILLAITKKGVLPTSSDWQTLGWWNAAERSFGTTLSKTTPETYRFSIIVDSNANNSIATKSISSVAFDITGTQHP